MKGVRKGVLDDPERPAVFLLRLKELPGYPAPVDVPGVSVWVVMAGVAVQPLARAVRAQGLVRGGVLGQAAAHWSVQLARRTAAA